MAPERYLRPQKAGRLLLWVPVLAGLAACGDLLGTGGPRDPRIKGTLPNAGATDVSVHSDVEIRFSTELDETTLLEGVKLLEGDREMLTLVFLIDPKTVRLRPTEPLDFGTEYTVRVEPTVQSKWGKSLSDQESWTFSTEGDGPPVLQMDSLRQTLEILAHDSMGGRGSGTVDEARAAEIVRRRFQVYGLEPAPGGDLQAFDEYADRLDRMVSSQNVLAAVAGSGALAQEWVVVGAHYDHIGLRLQPDSTMGLNNGADDNASGTSLILELARVFQDYVERGGMPVEDRRSVLFAAWGAEEVGLLGSCHYVWQAPAVPLARTVAVMNFDMVGRLRDRVLTLRGYETSPSWAPMVQNSNDPQLVLFDVSSSKANSDFACFMQRGIPYLFLHTGTHAEYHTPADDVDLINFPGLADVGQVALRVLIRLAVMDGSLN